LRSKYKFYRVLFALAGVVLGAMVLAGASPAAVGAADRVTSRPTVSPRSPEPLAASSSDRLLLKDRFIGKEDVKILRMSELLGPPNRASYGRDGVPDRREFVQVRFAKGVLADFLDLMENETEFVGPANRQRFLNLTRTEQLQRILKYTGTTLVDGFEIESDPLVFQEFKKVLPIIQRGCGTRQCHGGPTPAKPFGLGDSYLQPRLNMYTNFVILDRVAVGGDDLLNRDNPQASLILQYGLPTRLADRVHPEPIKPVFRRGLTDANYRAVLAWIQMLRVPRPRTGVQFPGYPEPLPPGAELIMATTSQPAPASQPSP